MQRQAALPAELHPHPCQETLEGVSQLILGLGKDAHTFTSFILLFDKSWAAAALCLGTRPYGGRVFSRLRGPVPALPWGHRPGWGKSRT